jgi:hypothetical protein
MRKSLFIQVGLEVPVVALVLTLTVACNEPDPAVQVSASPTVIAAPQPKPPELVDGVLEIGTGERPTLSVHAFYDADKNDKRGPSEIALEMAGLRLTPVRDGEFGYEKTGPGRIVRTTKDGLLIARVPSGLYRLEYANLISAGEDPNAAQWATAEEIVSLDKDKSLDLPAFCQVKALVQPSPVGSCTPAYDLKPRAFLAAVPEEVQAGQIATLRFRADDEASVTLEPFGEVESFRETDFFERTVKPETTTTYTLRAKNAYGTREIPVIVVVKP